MKHVFADTCFWVAITDPQDGLHEASRYAQLNLGRAVIHTTDEVLTEYLNYFSKRGRDATKRTTFRSRASLMVRRILDNPNILVHAQTREGLRRGAVLYAARSDKNWSLVDCVSINTMTDHGIMEALTNDHHVVQAGFTILIHES